MGLAKFHNRIKYFIAFLSRRIIRSQFGQEVRFGNNIQVINTTIGSYCGLAEYSSVNNSNINDYSSIGRYSKINNCNIGKFVSISWDTTVGAIEHDYHRLTTNAFPYAKRVMGCEYTSPIVLSTTIGNDVWVGANSVILAGLKIGDGSVIGAGSVVTKNIPPYEIWAGVPAKKIKNRFSKKISNKILKLKYWEWSEQKLRKNIKLFDFPIDEININQIIQQSTGE